ncbi:MAG TPA: hypothetical protein VHM24_04580 [Gemmatimonadaceae bacterium]|nr:hypothetical protein [Gemmatimonadaceae bacterium]
MQQHQARRFAKLIMEADSALQLKKLLREIADAHLPEPLFSDLYVLIRKRAHDIEEADLQARDTG